MVRPTKLPNRTAFMMRTSAQMYSMLKDIAAQDSAQLDQVITVQDLIRDAINYVFVDNERMRECFKRTRTGATNRRRPHA